jgi:hypothetical protein
MEFSASILDALYRASLSARAAQSSISLTQRVALSHAIAVSGAEVLVASTTMTWAALAVVSTTTA